MGEQMLTLKHQINSFSESKNVLNDWIILVFSSFMRNRAHSHKYICAQRMTQKRGCQNEVFLD